MVSVIIPVYNRAKTIKKSIDSVLNQSFQDIEVVVVDDGSTDDTALIVKEISDPRVRYYYQENMGACVARNHGIDVSSGELIAFQDSDDFWYPEKLQKQVDVILRNPSVDIVCCKTLCKKLDGSIMKSLELHKEGIISKEVGPYGISTQTLLVKRFVFNNIRFDPKVTRYQDLDFLLSASKNHLIYCVSEYLVERVIGEDSITNHPDRIYDMSSYFQIKHSDIMNDKKQFLSYFLASMLIDAAKNMPNYIANKYLAKAFELNHSFKIIVKIALCKVRKQGNKR